MSSVLVADEIDSKFDEILIKNKIDVTRNSKVSEQALVDLVAPYHGVVVRSRIKIRQSHIDAGKNLKIIGRAGTGVDNIDVSAATKRGIVVVNAPYSNTQSVAEHVFALMFCAARKILGAVNLVKSGGWDRSKFTGTELSGKTIGVIGLGKIGLLVARYAKLFNMKVFANSPSAMRDPERRKKITGAGIDLVDLNQLLAESDFITIHVPLNNTTRRMIGSNQLDMVKQGCVIINTSRGEVIDESALYDALTKGRIGAACLDVYEKEPPEPNNPLLKLDNVIATPHIAAMTREAQVRAAVDIADEFVQFFSTGKVNHAVNPQVLS